MDPNKVDKAMKSLYTVWLSVMAVLSIQFARTIQMANSIAEFMGQPVDRFIAPIVVSTNTLIIVVFWCSRFVSLCGFLTWFVRFLDGWFVWSVGR